MTELMTSPASIILPSEAFILVHNTVLHFRRSGFVRFVVGSVAIRNDAGVIGAQPILAFRILFREVGLDDAFFLTFVVVTVLSAVLAVLITNINNGAVFFANPKSIVGLQAGLIVIASGFRTA